MLSESEVLSLETEQVALVSVHRNRDYRFSFIDSKGFENNIHLGIRTLKDAIEIRSHTPFETEEVRVCISKLIREFKRLISQKKELRLHFVTGLLSFSTPFATIEDLKDYKKHLDLPFVYHTYKDRLMDIYETALRMENHPVLRQMEPCPLYFFGKDGLNFARVLARLKIAFFEQEIKYVKTRVLFRNETISLNLKALDYMKKEISKLGIIVNWF